MMSQDTFSFPYNELHVDNPKPGDFGEICLKVEVVSVDKEGVVLRKHGEVKVTEPFKDISTEELRKKIGEVDDTEMPIQKER